MKLAVIWIDREHASLFHLSEERMERQHLKLHHTDHHTHLRDQRDHDREARRLFAEAAHALESADRIVVIGPGVAKHHFYNYLAEEQPALARKVASIETVDHPSDAQIAALTRKMFEKAGA